MPKGILSLKVKCACSLLGFILVVNLAWSATVDSVTAKTAASNFYAQKYNIAAPALSIVHTEISASGEAEYYVYNINSKNGFVIIAADDAVDPILGYSSEGVYSPSNISPEFAFWMQRYKTQIEYIRQHNIAATATIQNKWNGYKNNIPDNNQRVQSAVGPLVQTLWAQAPYYNEFCPGTGENQAVAGCVATAMAQVMKYWAFPPHGLGAYSYTDVLYGALSANFDTTNYNWAGMPLNVTRSNAPVAILTYDCGVAVEMVYSPSSSGSYLIDADNSISAQSAFLQYFGYNPSTSQGLYRSNFTTANWTSLLVNELNNNRPLLYAGSGNQGGHAWVCDGYEANGDFHMNWGWGGSYDGYFNINSLNPSGIDLNSTEEVLIGIEPSPAVVVFSANKRVVWAGDTVTFSDNSFGPSPVVSRQWSLPGAATDNPTLQNPVVVYPSAGTYNAAETVTTGNGSNSLTQSNYITVLDNNTVNVYPSVNQGTFTVQLQNGALTGSNLQFSLYNMLGERMYTTTLAQYSTQVTLNVAPGMYFFRAFNSLGKPVSTGKIAIQQ